MIYSILILNSYFLH